MNTTDWMKTIMIKHHFIHLRRVILLIVGKEPKLLFKYYLIVQKCGFWKPTLFIQYYLWWLNCKIQTRTLKSLYWFSRIKPNCEKHYCKLIFKYLKIHLWIQIVSLFTKIFRFCTNKNVENVENIDTEIKK